jgi:hypothetical protein
MIDLIEEMSTTRKDLILPIAAVLLFVFCCAGPFIVAGLGSALLLAALRAHPLVIAGPLVVVAVIAVFLVVRARKA